jgi:hypothetical protein
MVQSGFHGPEFLTRELPAITTSYNAKRIQKRSGALGAVSRCGHLASANQNGVLFVCRVR